MWVWDSDLRKKFSKEKKIREPKKIASQKFLDGFIEKNTFIAGCQIFRTLQKQSWWPWSHWWPRPLTWGHESWPRSPVGLISIITPNINSICQVVSEDKDNTHTHMHSHTHIIDRTAMGIKNINYCLSLNTLAHHYMPVFVTKC